MHRTAVTLDCLVINPAINPRSAVAEIADIKAQIRENGFSDALWVRLIGDGTELPLTYEIIDGSRRFRALQELQAEGALPADFEVAVDVFEADDARARDMALAANVVRADLSPADEAVGFYRLKLSGLDEDQIAAHYAVPQRRVAQRIRLGSLPEPILTALREGKIRLDAAEAFTLTTSAERQVEVYESLRDDPRRPITAVEIRRALTSDAVHGDDARASFVGDAAYEAAGGVIDRDLFSESSWWRDGALLDRLFNERLEETICALKDEGWGAIHVVRENTWEVRDWPRETPAGKRAITDEQKARLAEIETLIETLGEAYDTIENTDEGSLSHDEWERLYNRQNEIEVEIDSLRAEAEAINRKPFTRKQMATTGVVITISNSDGVILHHGVTPPAKAAKKSRGDSAASAGDDGDGTAEAQPAAEPAGYSEAAETLMVQAAQYATKLALMARPALAARLGLAARIHAAVARYNGTVFRHRHEEQANGEGFRAVWLQILQPFDGADLDMIATALETATPEAITVIEATLAADTLRFDSLRNPEARRIIELADPVMTAEGFAVDAAFLKLLGREQIAAIITECGARPPPKTRKKSDLVTEALPLIAAEGWLPAPLRTPSYAGPGSNAWADTRADAAARQQAAE